MEYMLVLSVTVAAAAVCWRLGAASGKKGFQWFSLGLMVAVCWQFLAYPYRVFRLLDFFGGR